MTDIKDLWEELKQKRDELRVQIHLASKDAQDEWDELEVKMKEFSKRAEMEKTGESVGTALQGLGQELMQGYKRIRKAVRDDD